MSRPVYTDKRNPALLSVRAALVIALALILGGLAGVLAYLARQPVAGAALTGLAATCGALIALDKIVEVDPVARGRDARKR
jgi:hypothetical protein